MSRTFHQFRIAQLVKGIVQNFWEILLLQRVKGWKFRKKLISKKILSLKPNHYPNQWCKPKNNYRRLRVNWNRLYSMRKSFTQSSRKNLKVYNKSSNPDFHPLARLRINKNLLVSIWTMIQYKSKLMRKKLQQILLRWTHRLHREVSLNFYLKGKH